ncbi:MFS transporter [soil metagenome]
MNSSSSISRKQTIGWLVLLAAGGTFAVTMGARQSMGLFLNALNTSTGLGLASISLAFAVGQLWWGLTQPFAGMAADRFGSGRVLVVGLSMIALGTALTPFMRTTPGLIFTLGILASGGAGLAGPSVLLSSVMRLLPPEKRGVSTGIVNAGGSFGQFIFAPIAAAITALAGWVIAVQAVAALVLLALPAAWVLRGTMRSMAAAEIASGKAGGAADDAAAKSAAKESAGVVLKRALTNPSYLYLCIGFAVCGFHVAFIAVHLPGVVVACALPAAVGAWALGTVGLFNIVGSLLMGWAMGFRGGIWRMKSLLSLVYASRAVAVVIFMLAPKTEVTMLVFSAVIGLTYLSTVPPTAGLVARFFGTQHMGLLFGVIMLAHQLGGFMGAYMGGKAFEWTGSYDWMFYVDVLLAVGAALIHLPIKEQSRVPVGATPALAR